MSERTAGQNCPGLESRSSSSPAAGLDRLAASRRAHRLFAGSLPSPESDSAFDLGRDVAVEPPALDSPDIACQAAVDSSAVVPGTVAAADRGIVDPAEGTFLAVDLVDQPFLVVVAFQAEAASLAETTAGAVQSQLVADILDGSASAIALNFVVLASEAFRGIAAVVELDQPGQASVAFQGTAAAD